MVPTNGSNTTRPRILLVDDEVHLLEGLSRNLRSSPYDVVTAASGVAALETIRTSGPFAVIVADLNMPGMDGASFLMRARDLAPDSVRVLFTGQPDLERAIAAVNQGSIFRFITKPCSPLALRAALHAAAEHHRLITSERELLEQTLQGSVRALIEILSLVSPAAFGRATRIRRLMTSLLEAAGIRQSWEVEIAGMLSEIGTAILPGGTLEKLLDGNPLTEEEEHMVARTPQVIDQVLENIPRLESVREILRYQGSRFDGRNGPGDKFGAGIPWGARALKALRDFDTLESKEDENAALITMRGRTGWYDPAILDALEAVVRDPRRQSEIQELPLNRLRPGMRLAQDIRSIPGILLVAHGQEVTPSILERVRNFMRYPGVQEPIRVLVPPPAGHS